MQGNREAMGIRRSVTTDDRGAFAATDVPPGEYRVDCRIQGYMQLDRLRVQVEESQRVENVLVEPVPRPKLTGRVLRADGTPLADQSNLQLRLAIVTPHGPQTISVWGRTDAEGRFLPKDELSLPWLGAALAALPCQ